MADGKAIAVETHRRHTAGGIHRGCSLTDIVTLEDAQRCYLRWATARHMGDRKSLAVRLGISERTLFRKLVDAGLAGR